MSSITLEQGPSGVDMWTVEDPHTKVSIECLGSVDVVKGTSMARRDSIVNRSCRLEPLRTQASVAGASRLYWAKKVGTEAERDVCALYKVTDFKRNVLFKNNGHVEKPLESLFGVEDASLAAISGLGWHVIHSERGIVRSWRRSPTSHLGGHRSSEGCPTRCRRRKRRMGFRETAGDQEANPCSALQPPRHRTAGSPGGGSWRRSELLSDGSDKAHFQVSQWEVTDTELREADTTIPTVSWGRMGSCCAAEFFKKLCRLFLWLEKWYLHFLKT